MFLPLTPIRFLHRAVDLYGKKAGVVCGNRSFTYDQFGERCERLATALAARGIGRGDRVAYLSFNTHKLLEGYYGVVQARAVVMPLNVRLTPAELAVILNHAEPRVLMFENDFAATVEHLRQQCPSVETWVALDGGASDSLDYETLLAEGHPQRADINAYDESAIAELFYTSGSTGTPKGVMLSHRTLYLHALSIVAGMDYPDSSVELHTIPLFHANGWGRPQSATLMGATQVMVRRFEPDAVLRLIEAHRATDMSLVPTMANALLNAPELGRHDFSSLRRIWIGGAASSPELVERMEKAFGCQILAGYGLTETAPVLTGGRPKGTLTPASEAERYRRQAMAGWPFPGVELRVVDSHMNDVPRDMQAIGEVVARSDNVMEGYYKDPSGTAAVMSGQWFHTGDMAVWDEETFIHIVDRSKEIIISGGENISSLEIEKAIAAHPDVFECAVVASPDETWGEVPAAIVYPKHGANLTAEAILEFLQGRVARFKLPHIIEFTSEPLPKTGTGKIRKLLLKEKLWQGKEKRVQG